MGVPHDSRVRVEMSALHLAFADGGGVGAPVVSLVLFFRVV